MKRLVLLIPLLLLIAACDNPFTKEKKDGANENDKGNAQNTIAIPENSEVDNNGNENNESSSDVGIDQGYNEVTNGPDSSGINENAGNGDNGTGAKNDNSNNNISGINNQTTVKTATGTFYGLADTTSVEIDFNGQTNILFFDEKLYEKISAIPYEAQVYFSYTENELGQKTIVNIETIK